jgi:hypothetical protein
MGMSGALTPGEPSSLLGATMTSPSPSYPEIPPPSKKYPSRNWYRDRRAAGLCVTWKCRQTAISGMARCSNCLSGKASKVATIDVPDTVLAYFAGIVDGEGCVAVRSTKYKKRRTGEIVEFYHLEVVITNSNRALLDRIASYFGGHIHTRKKGKKHWKQVWSWHLGYRAGEQFLMRILPYLEIKKREAEISIACQRMNDRRDPHDKKQAIRDQQKIMFEQVKEIKRVS